MGMGMGMMVVGLMEMDFVRRDALEKMAQKQNVGLVYHKRST